ncbi:MAG: TrkA family potassium uptake protein [Lachnospiraceae bacterium]|nr:TrkA family potassium uptake protein [Lachnospiraceae bacterium]
MKTILVVGLGRFGRHAVKKLDELGNQVMAVDINPDRVQAVLPYVTNAQIGDSTSEEFLKSLGISNFNECIVCIGDNFQNSLETTSLLKELGAQHVIARASRDRHAKFLLRNGADEIVYPEQQMADLTAMRCSADHILDYIPLNEDFGIFEIDVPPTWIGHTVQELDVRNRYHLNVMAIKRSGNLDLEIHADTHFETTDTVLVLGKSMVVQKILGDGARELYRESAGEGIGKRKLFHRG